MKCKNANNQSQAMELMADNPSNPSTNMHQHHWPQTGYPKHHTPRPCKIHLTQTWTHFTRTKNTHSRPHHQNQLPQPNHDPTPTNHGSPCHVNDADDCTDATIFKAPSNSIWRQQPISAKPGHPIWHRVNLSIPTQHPNHLAPITTIRTPSPNYQSIPQQQPLPQPTKTHSMATQSKHKLNSLPLAPNPDPSCSNHNDAKPPRIPYGATHLLPPTPITSYTLYPKTSTLVLTLMKTMWHGAQLPQQLTNWKPTSSAFKKLTCTGKNKYPGTYGKSSANPQLSWSTLLHPTVQRQPALNTN